MSDMERRKFEDSFQEAFKDAEVSPSENVWTNIELDLVKAEGDTMKRRLVFFKMLAAASVIFALCVGGVGYYIFNTNQEGEFAQVSTVQSEQPESSKEITTDNNKVGEVEDPTLQREGHEPSQGQSAFLNEKNQDRGKVLSLAEKQSRSTSPVSEQDHLPAQDKNAGVDNKMTLAEQKVRSDLDATVGLPNGSANALVVDKGSLSNDEPKFINNESINTLGYSSKQSALITKSQDPSGETRYAAPLNSRTLPSLYQPKAPTLEIHKPATVVDPGVLLLAKLADEEKEFARAEKESKKNKSENLWTSVGFAAGAFNANNPSVTPTASNSYYALNSGTTNAAAKQSEASGLAYSLGVSVGTKLSDRWVLQGGFNYMTQSSDYTANGVVVKDNNYAAPQAESINALFDKSSDFASQALVAQTYPYNVNNNVRFVSVPVQAGYLVVNKKFGVQVNAGVSTDLFLQNTITPDGGGLTRTTQGRGDDSPYRSLNFSGLMGTELSYRLGNRYRVALNPGLRYPFSSVYKSNTGVHANPLTFDVGLRFRYIFH